MSRTKKLFGIAKINGGSKLWFCTGPIPHWHGGSIGLPLFLWRGTRAQAFKWVRQIGGWIYPIEEGKS